MEDYLTRQPYLDLLKSIIAKQKDNPTGYSFAIDGEWGSGKTWILQNLEEQLLQQPDNKYLIFHYNAWENDFYDEPLVAILSVMIDSLDNFSKAEENINKINSALIHTSIKVFKNLAISVVNYQIKDKAGLDFRDVIDDFKDVGNANTKHAKMKKEIDNYSSLKKLLSEIHSQIKELSKEVNILLFVDELDRCLPEYAIKVLERLHHVCNEMPVIQIIAYSGKALANGVSQAYGGNITDEQTRNAFCAHFMEKFVKLVLPLNCGMTGDNLSILYEKIDQSFAPMFDESEQFLVDFYNLFLRDIPIRNRKQILETVKMIHELTLASNDFKNFAYTYELLCCEIIIVMDRVLLHAQSPLNITYVENENILSLTVSNDETSRFSEILPLEKFRAMIEQIHVPFIMQQVVGIKFDKYSIHICSCASIVFLIFADGKYIDVQSEFSYRLGRPSYEIVNQSKIFMSKFYELMYQFF